MYSRRKFLFNNTGAGLKLILLSQVSPWVVRSSFGDQKKFRKSSFGKDDLVSVSASQLAVWIRERSVTSEEIVRMHLEQIRDVNPSIHAVCELAADRALKEAKEADRALIHGEVMGPLHGVPVTIKDSLNTEGIVSTGGTKGREGFIPDRDATAVGRLREAGAIVLGKTNTPELTLSYETDNAVYGRSNNPYDLDRTPGGSSGGAAAILASGGSPLDLGSDTAGSIRVPAHFCGVTGIKPTAGRVSRAGHIIPPGGTVGEWTQIGPMSRYVEDLLLVLPILSGPDGQDPEVVPVPWKNPARVNVSSLRVVFYTDQGRRKPSGVIVEAVQAAADFLKEEGCEVENVLPDSLVSAILLSGKLNTADGGDYYRRLLQKYGTTNPAQDLQSFLAYARSLGVTGREYSRLLVEWTEVKQSMLQFMQDREIIICPVCSSTAPKHDSREPIDYTYCMVFNLLGWPAAVIPAGFSREGLPYGVQIVGRPWNEHVVLAVAQYLEKRFHVRRSAVHF